MGCLARSSSRITRPTISLVKPRVSTLAQTMTVPTTIMGRRRPHFDVFSSAMTPTMGCTMSPESGPATQTSEVLLFVRPSLRR